MSADASGLHEIVIRERLSYVISRRLGLPEDRSRERADELLGLHRPTDGPWTLDLLLRLLREARVEPDDPAP